VRSAKGEIVNRERCAAILGVARTTLDDWVERGCPVHKPSSKRGVAAEFDTAAVIDWRLANAIAAASADTLDAQKEKARLYKEQADFQAMRNAKMRSALVTVEEVEHALTDAFRRCRSRLLTIPHKAAPRVVGKTNTGEVFILLKMLIHEALEELSETEVVAQVAPGDAGDEAAYEPVA
jgi:phage terminase Nu1 subunit (DNA packaging protein)